MGVEEPTICWLEVAYQNHLSHKKNIKLKSRGTFSSKSIKKPITCKIKTKKPLIRSSPVGGKGGASDTQHVPKDTPGRPFHASIEAGLTQDPQRALG